MATGETKVELRGHENYLEVVAFAPVASYQSICELSGIALVRKLPHAIIAAGLARVTFTHLFVSVHSRENIWPIHCNGIERQVNKAVGCCKWAMYQELGT